MRKFLNGLSFILLLSILIMGCGKSSTPVENVEPPQTGGGGGDTGSKLSTITLENGNNIYGHIVDIDYNPIPDVVVSDGYTVVKTNAKGEYQFKKNSNSGYVFYSAPAGYEVATATGRNMALFYAKLNGNSNPEKHDFYLTKLTKDESKFVLYAIGDPQVANNAEVDRFINETMADIKEQLASSSLPSYGLSMGDVVADQPSLFNSMKSAMGSSRMKIWTTVGNHDKTGGNATTPRNASTFESQFGPLNYSFNRGNVHFVCLDNVVFSNNSSYSLGFSTEQIDWLEKDLSFVSKDKLLILYFHMPMRGTNFSTRSRLLNLVKDFKEVHFMSGHTHYNENYIHNISGKEVYEHVHAASCGAWWKSTINGDGTPNGYAIYEIDGTTIKDWIYKPTKLPKEFQLRIHLGNATYGGSYGYFTYGKSATTLIANVWNADPKWKIEVYMDNQKLGNMTLNTSLNKDAWSLGYHLGILNRNPNNYTTTTKHLYTYELPTGSYNSLKVVATDRFGRSYEQSVLTTDLTAAASY